MENPDIARIHDFWYSRPPVEWFMPPEGFDSACATQFGGLVQDARDGNLDQWTSDRNGSLAIIILLDQFSRNIHRDTPNAFSADPKALDIAIRAIAKGWDGEVPMAQAVTFYLPLMHNESLLAQIACLAFLEKRRMQSEPGSEDWKFLSGSIKASKSHLEAIERFGRFPTRNKILGRESTPEELEFVEKQSRVTEAPEASGS
ncbi:uncharacterized protein HMPREF1541_04999 [Cyphellophora europaea CBS 101466]|uniref:DUF924 domain-containing protein n=1 Tax=Cyphellophora europaea (strain CBS 101466) TaxID=1220924 RepID=W2RYG0_CYPE1|nr:uncharacterized protein HMPREF1541_04999 [Cyphellophora europaea CBS 101466]ETN40719.1 hypothetical protein HMPREF1541_04999 [Cyphellophora europaea CBS 101466]